MADSWWGEFGKFVLSADWAEPWAGAGPGLPHPTPEEEGHFHSALEFRVPGFPQTLSS